jgi:hypothetical protein
VNLEGNAVIRKVNIENRKMKPVESLRNPEMNQEVNIENLEMNHEAILENQVVKKNLLEIENQKKFGLMIRPHQKKCLEEGNNYSFFLI